MRKAHIRNQLAPINSPSLGMRRSAMEAMADAANVASAARMMQSGVGVCSLKKETAVGKMNMCRTCPTGLQSP